MNAMRTLVVIFVVVAVAPTAALGQDVPQLIHYQATLTENGQPYSGEVQIAFSIYEVASGGTALWSETQTVTVTDGCYDVLLGSAEPFTGDVFGGVERYLGITVGAGSEMTPRIRIGSVGYALNADRLDGQEGADFVLQDEDYGRPNAAAELYEGGAKLSEKYLGLSAKAADSDQLDGYDSSEFLSVHNDFGRSAVSPDLYEGTTKLSEKYVNKEDLDHLDAADGSPASAVHVDDVGRVGVGTATPAEKLDVAGMVQMTGFKMGTGAASGQVLTSDAAGVGTWQDAVSGDDGDWTVSGDDMYSNVSGNVGIGTTLPSHKLSVDGTVHVNGFRMPTGAVSGRVLTANSSGAGTWQEPVSGDDGDWTISGSDMYSAVSGNVGIGTATPEHPLDVTGRILNRSETTGNPAAAIDGTSQDGAGWVATFGPNGEDNVLLIYPEGHPDGGWVGTFAPNGEYNVLLSSVVGYPNHGYVAVYGPVHQTPPPAGMYIDDIGQSVVFADVKNFRVSNPAEPGTDIWYACIEGPEAAAYIRGTGHLVNGEAVITLPDHFRTIARSEEMTVQLTPLSPESKGLAVVEKSVDGIAVRELSSGTGTYDFDYTVMAVRKGQEDYRVIRPVSEARVAAAETEARR